MMRRKVYIVSACRTAIGKFGGGLAQVPTRQLGSVVIREVLRRAKVEPELVEEIIMGCVLQAGLGQNIARQAAVDAGIPVNVPSFTVNQVCGSGLKSVNLAAESIASGVHDVVIAGGMENMSTAPYLLKQARFGYRMNDNRITDAMVHDALWDAFYDCHMGITAENIAEKYGFTREMQDEFAAISQNRCEKAQSAGIFQEEIVPVEIKTKKETILFVHDESPRTGVTKESLSRLKPAFKENGTVTAANSSSINDGAAAVLLMSEEKVQQLGITPMAEWIDGISVGVQPEVMGLGAAEAAVRLLEKTGYSVDDIELFEANEAFAAQALAAQQIIGYDPAKVNVNGGAIALGHPVGASGCRILVSLLYELLRRGGGKGIATLCIGGGMGTAACVEV